MNEVEKEAFWTGVRAGQDWLIEFLKTFNIKPNGLKFSLKGKFDGDQVSISGEYIEGGFSCPPGPSEEPRMIGRETYSEVVRDDFGKITGQKQKSVYHYTDD